MTRDLIRKAFKRSSRGVGFFPKAAKQTHDVGMLFFVADDFLLIQCIKNVKRELIKEFIEKVVWMG